MTPEKSSRTGDWISGALSALDPAGLDYADWLAVGMALHAAGRTVDEWIAWSARDRQRFDEAGCRRRWEGFDAGGGVGPGTLWHMARARGWSPPPDSGKFSRFTPARKRPRPPEPEPLPRPVSADTAAWLRTLFTDDALVRYVHEIDGHPAGLGDVSTAAELADRLEAGMDPPQYIGINPMSGPGGRDADVEKFLYCLVECDAIDLERQWAGLSEAAAVLPVVSIVYSGGRSLHALVRVDAADRTQYDERVRLVYDWLERRGLPVDRACKNPSRLTRVPGARRGGATQDLLYLRPPDHCPPLDLDTLRVTRWPVALSEWAARPPARRPWLIEGIVRGRTVLCVAGRAKAGKSFACMHLAAAVSCGEKFLDKPCAAGAVLHVDLELHEDTLWGRYERIASYHGAALDRIHVMPMRDHAPDLGGLLEDLSIIIPRLHPAVVIIDPVYRLADLDEIDAKQVTAFLRDLYAITREHSTSLVYTHHHRKGSLQETSAVDRPSGSGVWGRMPDAMLDLTVEDEAARLVRAEWVVREVPPQAPSYARFIDGLLIPCDPPNREEKPESRRRRSG